MALTRTTLASAVAQNDINIVVASATGAAAGTFVKVDQEVMKIAQNYVSGVTLPVVRGQDGSQQTTHKVSAAAVFFLASDETGPSAQTMVQFPSGAIPRVIVSYSASGAIANPAPGQDMVALLNGASLLAMTMTSPTVDMDGSILTICGTGTVRAHTVTYTTTGFGNVGATADVVTMSATQVQAFSCIAAGGFWQLIALGTATASVTGPMVA